jgi:hypothetical protein
VKPFEIYRARFRWRGCDDPRPWLLVRTGDAGWLCFAISTKDYDSGPFELPSQDPDFPATGLKVTSYVYDAESFHELPAGAFMTRLGLLQGDLLRRFRDSSGV